MALFGLKKNTEKKVEAVKDTVKKTTTKAKVVKKPATKAIAERVNTNTIVKKDVILRPRITEKAGLSIESQNVYTFEVTKDATKSEISKAIKDIYKVNPIKVRTIHLPAKTVIVRGRYGTQSSIKKALVYLKKGDKIEIA
jgi:large subunit ribosomal protein L23